MTLLFVFLFLTLFSLSNAFTLPSPQCISHISNEIITKEEKYHWRSVYEELIEMESVKEDLFALFGYQLMEKVEERCTNDEVINVSKEESEENEREKEIISSSDCESRSMGVSPM